MADFKLVFSSSIHHQNDRKDALIIFPVFRDLIFIPHDATSESRVRIPEMSFLNLALISVSSSLPESPEQCGHFAGLKTFISIFVIALESF